MFTVYIIRSLSTGKFYIGSSSNVDKRLYYHNAGKNKSTRKRGPWQIVYRELSQDKKVALVRESQIKKYKGGEAFKKLIM